MTIRHYVEGPFHVTITLLSDFELVQPSGMPVTFCLKKLENFNRGYRVTTDFYEHTKTLCCLHLKKVFCFE